MAGDLSRVFFFFKKRLPGVEVKSHFNIRGTEEKEEREEIEEKHCLRVLKAHMI